MDLEKQPESTIQIVVPLYELRRTTPLRSLARATHLIYPREQSSRDTSFILPLFKHPVPPLISISI
jgi:hypothetical protein